MLVEVDEFLKGVVAAPMGVAGAVREFLELAKRGASGARTERRHYLGQRGDGLPVKQVDERGGGVLGRSHCGTITNTTIAIVCVPVLGPDDLIRLAFDDTLDLPPSTLRWRLRMPDRS